MHARSGLALALAAVLTPLVGSCSSGSDSACGPIVRETLDPASFVHVLGDEEPEYDSDPPTSGPHAKAPAFDGVVDEPIPRPVQVGALEVGNVIVQHRPDLEAGALEELEALAGDGVVVAPGEDLDNEVVATAWLHKRSCSAVDVEALQEFIDERLGHGPEDQATTERDHPTTEGD